ncbi:MAG: FxsA family protein [Rhodospirillaceae bacterium]|jgi:UPF0716 protein FxsA|nr:FxsA family protein [Rhodospirillaceae bacterium]MBT5667166.1 FxsA family protein [Rhodospirillaceae bacterium]MBT5812632.1 FxsA family protein [Rhodospirillaceae bacterium]
MGLILLLAFLATPIAEIAVFIEAGSRFGLWPTILAIIGTAILGAALLRWQGLSTWARASRSLQRNELPVEELFTGLCLVAAGALLLTPGFITDAVGFALFIPPVRRLLGLGLRRILKARGAVWVDGVQMDPNNWKNTDGSIIDGEFHENDPSRDRLPPNNDGRGDETTDPANSPWRKGGHNNGRDDS